MTHLAAHSVHHETLVHLHYSSHGFLKELGLVLRVSPSCQSAMWMKGQMSAASSSLICCVSS